MDIGGVPVNEPTHAPGWRGRPRRYGPIEDDTLPRWLEILEALAPAGCFGVFVLTMALVAYAYGADLLAGHPTW